MHYTILDQLAEETAQYSSMFSTHIDVIYFQLHLHHASFVAVGNYHIFSTWPGFWSNKKSMLKSIIVNKDFF